MAGHQQNPRKFSEKIAIHDRKTQEGMMEFDRIMREVKEITRGGPTNANEISNRGNNGVASTQAGMMPPTNYRSFPSGSLPNVSQMPPFPPFDPRTGVPLPGPSMMSPVPMQPMQHGAVHRGRSPGAHPHYHPYQPQGSSPHHSPGRYPSAERQQSNDMHMMIGMPPSGGFLVPPQDTNWRRTHSDPGLHASTLMHPNMPGSTGSQPHTPPQPGSPGQTPLGASPPGQSYMSHMVRPGSVDHHGGAYLIEPGPPFGVPAQNCAGSLPDLQASAATPGAFMSMAVGHPSANHEIGGGGGDTHYTSHPLAQQRHSVQLPVQFGQKFGGGAHAGTIAGYTMAYGGAEQMPPQYPSEVRSAPESPAGQESPVPSPGSSGHQQPGSPYSYIQMQMQNITMADTNQMSYYNTNVPNNAANFQYMTMHQQQQQYMQNVSSGYPQTTSAACEPMPGRLTLSPSGTQIPDIILTGVDNTTSHAVDSLTQLVPNAAMYGDGSLDSIIVDPNELSAFQAFDPTHIDQATEDLIRQDKT